MFATDSLAAEADRHGLGRQRQCWLLASRSALRVPRRVAKQPQLPSNVGGMPRLLF